MRAATLCNKLIWVMLARLAYGMNFKYLLAFEEDLFEFGLGFEGGLGDGSSGAQVFASRGTE